MALIGQSLFIYIQGYNVIYTTESLILAQDER